VIRSAHPGNPDSASARAFIRFGGGSVATAGESATLSGNASVIVATQGIAYLANIAFEVSSFCFGD
jgi:hypothetical protein